MDEPIALNASLVYQNMIVFANNILYYAKKGASGRLSRQDALHMRSDLNSLHLVMQLHNEHQELVRASMQYNDTRHPDYNNNDNSYYAPSAPHLHSPYPQAPQHSSLNSRYTESGHLPHISTLLSLPGPPPHVPLALLSHQYQQQQHHHDSFQEHECQPHRQHYRHMHDETTTTSSFPPPQHRPRSPSPVLIPSSPPAEEKYREERDYVVSPLPSEEASAPISRTVDSYSGKFRRETPELIKTTERQVRSSTSSQPSVSTTSPVSAPQSDTAAFISALTGSVPDAVEMPIQKKRGRKSAEGHRPCTFCNTVDTPIWRRGPEGPASLCNACGLKYMRANNKLRKKAAQSAASASYSPMQDLLRLVPSNSSTSNTSSHDNNTTSNTTNTNTSSNSSNSSKNTNTGNGSGGGSNHLRDTSTGYRAPVPKGGHKALSWHLHS